MRFAILLSLFSLLLPSTFARPWTPSDPCPTEVKARVADDPCRYADDDFSCHKSKVQISTLNVIHNVLLHCPNITSLELRVAGAGCSNWPERYNFPFNRSGNDRYPALKKIRLEGYRFGDYKEVQLEPPRRFWDWFNAPLYLWQKGRWKSWVREQMPVNDIPLNSNFFEWYRAMDWSAVEEFGIADRAFTDEMIDILPGAMKSLTKLETTNLTFITALKNNTLTDLQWIGHSCATDLATILAHQGQSLKSLEFRCEEMSCPSFPSRVDISSLPTMASNINHLAINIERNGTWPLDDLATIASLPYLQTANLYFRLQSDCRLEKNDLRWNDTRLDYNSTWCRGTNQYLTPFLNSTAGLQLYRHMRNERPSEAEPLGEVAFLVGDWSRSWDGPLYSPPWLEYRSVNVTCSAEDREEGEAWCVSDGDGLYYTGSDRWDDVDEWVYEQMDIEEDSEMEGIKDWQHV